MLKSAVAVTYELDDIEAGTDELARLTFEKLSLGKNSFGFLICDSDVEHEKFAGALSRKIGAPIVGFTSTAMFSGDEGLCDTAALLTTVTSDDVNFSLAVSEPLTPENVKEQIHETYDKARSGLDGEPALVMAFPPYTLGIMLDIYPRELGAASGGLPVFGGLPAHDEVNGRSAVYIGDDASGDRMAVLLMSGALKPVMSVQNRVGELANLKRTVTKSKDNVVYKVGDGNFTTFLARFGLDVSKLANPNEKTMSFTTYPLLVEKPGTDDVVVRTLHGVNLETGAGTAIGEVPEGSVISVGVLKQSDIEQSARASAADILEKMRANETDGYVYSTIFGISCVARYYVMLGRGEIEESALRNGLAEAGDISLSGYYSFGEICPTSVTGGKAANAAHNESLVLLAL
jgi:hypothetical protein